MIKLPEIHVPKLFGGGQKTPEAIDGNNAASAPFSPSGPAPEIPTGAGVTPPVGEVPAPGSDTGVNAIPEAPVAGNASAAVGEPLTGVAAVPDAADTQAVISDLQAQMSSDPTSTTAGAESTTQPVDKAA
ncbi:MAG: hypothetical protein AAB512_00305 [Patescibacteria group bacterium]